MHDYMKALYHRFEAPSRRMEYMDRKIKRTHSQLARLLGKSEKKLLLRIADMEDELRDEACLNSFISGFRLAQGIQQELLADRRGGEMTLYASDRPEDFGALAGMFLGRPLQGAVRPVDIEKY